MPRVETPHPESAERLASDKPAPAARWQFSLREAILFTTASAGAAALAGYKGLGSLAMSVGLIVSWLNVRGLLRPLQTRRARPRMFYLGWLLLGASLFLPAIKGCNNTTIPGWQTAYVCAAAEVEALDKILFKHEPPDIPTRQAVAEFAWVTWINAANVLLILSPLLLWRLQRDKGAWLGAALAVAAVGAWSIPLREPHMLIGCYVWCAAFLVLLTSFPLRTRTFLWMLALAMLLVIL